MRKLAVLFIALGAFAFAACSDDTTPVKKDTKPVVKKDGQVVKQDTGGTVQEDTGTTVKKDTGGVVTKKDGTVGPVTGWGTKCNQTKPCTAPLTCIMLSGYTDGFCTQECPAANKGQECPGAPAGQLAGCLLSDQAQTKFFCAFICALQGQTFQCPTELSCDTVENPPGSGQKACVPK